MLRGDLTSSPLRELLPQLGADASTGCAYVADPEGGELQLYLDAGLVIGTRPAPGRDVLAARLLADGHLSPEAVAELPTDDERAPSVAESLLASGALRREDHDVVALELALDVIDAACGWTAGAWRFRRRQRPGVPLPTPLSADEILARLRDRARTREDLAVELGVPGPLGEAVPTTASVHDADDLPAEARAVVAAVDGIRTIAAIGRRTGRSDIAVAQLLLTARPAPEAAPAPAPAEEPSSGATEPTTTADGAAGLPHPHTADASPDEADERGAWNRVAGDDEVLESLAKASEALNAALGDDGGSPQPESEKTGASALIRPKGPSATAPVEPVDPETAARRERLRAAAAAELAAAHAEAEEARRAYEAGSRAQVVDLGERREAARLAREEAAREEVAEPIVSNVPDEAAVAIAAPDEATEASATEEAEHVAAPGDSADVSDAQAAADVEHAVEAEDSTGAETETESADDVPVDTEAIAVQAPVDVEAPPIDEPETEAGTPDDLMGEAPADEPVEPEPVVAEQPAPPAPPAPEAVEPAPLPAARRWVGAIEDHSSATALLREMAGADAGVAPTKVEEPPPAVEPEAPPALPAAGLQRPQAPGSADTAALLRELSSLGAEESGGRPPAPAPRPGGAPRPAGPSHAAARKRKGLWGRG